MKSRAILLLLSLSSSLLCAQEQTAPRHTLRVLPLGDPPPFLQEVRNGVRYELPAPEGSVPPRDLQLAATMEGKEPLKLRLRLGSASTPLTFPLPETKVIEVRNGSSTWLKIPLSTSEASLALIWRGGPDWSKAGVMTIGDGATDRQGDCRFVNLTAKPMGLVWGKQRLKLEPRTKLLSSIPAGTEEQELSILYSDAQGNLRPCLATKVTPKADKLQQFIIYASDEKDPRTPVKVLPLEEPR
ncbi:hypothetical protein [Haloferula sp. BvORR071]|uniref:hypothetical protein n=1 Tax=Haloferula sp. BvORR071 TaxID=1396141 RepID=UPI00054F4786|nr:hypothetical protein [Haloferula sp. BvORR071]